jgi:hypothetical protein
MRTFIFNEAALDHGEQARVWIDASHADDLHELFGESCIGRSPSDLYYLACRRRNIVPVDLISECRRLGVPPPSSSGV